VQLGCGWSHINTPLSHMCYLPNLVVLSLTARVTLRRAAWKIWPLASHASSRSFKVNGT